MYHYTGCEKLIPEFGWDTTTLSLPSDVNISFQGGCSTDDRVLDKDIVRDAVLKSEILLCTNYTKTIQGHAFLHIPFYIHSPFIHVKVGPRQRLAWHSLICVQCKQ